VLHVDARQLFHHHKTGVFIERDWSRQLDGRGLGEIAVERHEVLVQRLGGFRLSELLDDVAERPLASAAGHKDAPAPHRESIPGRVAQDLAHRLLELPARSAPALIGERCRAHVQPVLERRIGHQAHVPVVWKRDQQHVGLGHDGDRPAERRNDGGLGREDLRFRLQRVLATLDAAGTAARSVLHPSG
jgi:hypothetical protein